MAGGGTWQEITNPLYSRLNQVTEWHLIDGEVGKKEYACFLEVLLRNGAI